MLLKKVVLIACLSLIFFSCSDNSSSPDSDGDAPELPSLESIQPDLSFFLNNNPQKAKQTANNFNAAKSIALSLGNVASYGQIYSGFFQSASQSGAEFQDGAWVWDYTYSYENESVSIVLTSRESGDNFLWDMTWSYQGTEESVDDYTIIEGRTAKDGNSGSWTLNTLDPNNSQEVPLMVSEWEKEGDSKVVVETTYYTDGAASGSFVYSEDSSDFFLTATGFDGNDNTEVHWNTDTQEGYYVADSEQMCWDGDLQDTEC